MQVLHQVASTRTERVLWDFANAEDAGVFRITPDISIVQTVDFFPPNVDDPYEFGRIAAANSLSDVYAVGARPISALSVLCLPRGKLLPGEVAALVRGAADQLRDAGVALLGGHTVENDQVLFGFAVTGEIEPGAEVGNHGARPRDRLVLTKALGVGIYTEPMRRMLLNGEEQGALLSSMGRLNRVASEGMRSAGAHACTDVTGFGLLGHALHLARGSRVTLLFHSELLPDVLRRESDPEESWVTKASWRNREYAEGRYRFGATVGWGVRERMVDPQTSGGLLVALPPGGVSGYISHLRKEGEEAWEIGEVLERGEFDVEVV